MCLWPALTSFICILQIEVLPFFVGGDEFERNPLFTHSPANPDFNRWTLSLNRAGVGNGGPPCLFLFSVFLPQCDCFRVKRSHGAKIQFHSTFLLWWSFPFTESPYGNFESYQDILEHTETTTHVKNFIQRLDREGQFGDQVNKMWCFSKCSCSLWSLLEGAKYWKGIIYQN